MALTIATGINFYDTDQEIQLIVNEIAKQYTVTVISGKRSKESNDRAGGEKDSEHLFGRAVDIVVKDVHPWKVASLLLSKYPKVRGIGVNIYAGVVHFDIRPTTKTGLPFDFWNYNREGKVI